MSLVENLVNQISSVNGVTRPQGFDLNDDTFAKLLEKASSSNTLNQTLSTEPLGAPAGFNIEPYDGIDNEIKKDSISQINEPIEIKDIDINDYFSTKIKTDNENSDFMNFAKKHAANAYSTFGKGFIANLSEFIQDATAML